MFSLVSRHAAARRSVVLLDGDSANRNTSSADLSAPAAAAAAATAATAQEPRLRGIIGYHNAFNDGAAEYDYEEIDRLLSSGLDHSLPKYPSGAPERVPAYDCTILKQGVVSVKLERKSPFDFVQQPQWFEAFVTLRGTMLNIHLPRQSGFLSSRPDRASDGIGKLLKSYTLQHAEAGLAADHKKVEMVPKNPVTSLLPENAIEHLKETDPHLFEHRHIYVIRLRLETDQLLFRFKTSDARFSWLSSICAATDLAPAIDDRTEPRYQTLPRRSRRRRETQTNVQLDDAALLEQQQRIAREQFPHLFRGDATAESTEPESSNAPVASMDNRDADADELDNSIFATAPSSSPARPTHNLGRLVSSVNRIFGDRSTSAALREVTLQGTSNAPATATATATAMGLAAASDEQGDKSDREFEEAKWNPNTRVDPVREARCIRRCMPTLLFNSRRANKLIIKDGVRMQIDWDRRIMFPYSAAPPSYEESQRLEEDSDESEAEQIETPGSMDLLHTITEQHEGPDMSVTTLQRSPSDAESSYPVRHQQQQQHHHHRRRRLTTAVSREDGVDCAASGSSGDDSTSSSSSSSSSYFTHKRPGWLSRLRKTPSNKPGSRQKAGSDERGGKPAALDMDFSDARAAHFEDAQRPITP